MVIELIKREMSSGADLIRWALKGVWRLEMEKVLEIHSCWPVRGQGSMLGAAIGAFWQKL